MIYYEDKELILTWLLQTLRNTVAGINLVNIAYKQLDDGDEQAILVYENGYRKTVNITADSGIAMIADIVKAMK